MFHDRFYIRVHLLYVNIFFFLLFFFVGVALSSARHWYYVRICYNIHDFETKQNEKEEREKEMS